MATKKQGLTAKTAGPVKPRGEVPRTPTLEEAMKKINEQAIEDMKRCKAEIDMVLAKYGFMLDAIITLREGSVRSQIRLVSRPAMPNNKESLNG